MGSWNATCGMSQLPIHSGNKVKLVFLKKSPYFEDSSFGNGFCYANRLFAPFYTPISGKYNDYGSLKNIDDPDDKHFNNILKALNMEKDDYDSFEELITDISRQEIPDLGFVFIHEDLYYKCIAINGKRQYGWGPESSDILSYMTPILTKFLKYDPLDFSNDGIYTKDLPTLIRSNIYSPTFNQPEVKDLLDFYIFQDFMEEGRKFWSLQGSAGSQDSNYSVAIFLGEYAKEKLKEYTDKYGEYEEE